MIIYKDILSGESSSLDEPCNARGKREESERKREKARERARRRQRGIERRFSTADGCFSRSFFVSTPRVLVAPSLCGLFLRVKAHFDASSPHSKRSRSQSGRKYREQRERTKEKREKGAARSIENQPLSSCTLFLSLSPSNPQLSTKPTFQATRCSRTRTRCVRWRTASSSKSTAR